MKIINEDKISEGTLYKRVAHYNEFDNGRVLHNWSKWSSEEAEERARKASLEDPNGVYYVAYDDIMNPSSDICWINGKSYSSEEAYKIWTGRRKG